MLICGVKLTHDGGVALVDVDGSDATLVVQVDMEKLDNNERYAPIPAVDALRRLLELAGVAPSEVDRFGVDGWFGGKAWCSEEIIPSSEVPRFDVAPYEDSPDDAEVHRPFPGSLGAGESLAYTSFRHVANHIACGYFTSPAAAREEDAAVLVWDGGILPRLYVWRASERRADSITTLFPMPGNTYGMFGGALDAFRLDVGEGPAALPERMIRHNLSTPGKMMAYAGLGAVDGDFEAVLDKLGCDHDWDSPIAGVQFSHTAIAQGAVMGLSDADMIATFQSHVGGLLVDALRGAVAELPDAPANLVLVGGCALNIKWNSRIRDAGIFDDVWVPPFANDSGIGLGVALSTAVASTPMRQLRWSVYGGLPPATSRLPAGWRSAPCSPRRLGELIHERGRPVVVIDGPAELGPRALGHRSILAPAVEASMKDELNAIKRRESYRPVAPICLEDDAPAIFEPGCRDAYMLFDHRVRPQWLDRIRAIVHVDGTARLQTISRNDDAVVTEILEGYRAVSGIPVLCNTSANHPGRGFFPDVESAAAWGEVDAIWSCGVLHTREGGQR